MRIPTPSGEDHPRALFSKAEVRELRQRFEEEEGVSLRQLAREKQCSPNTIRNLINGSSYPD